MVFKLYPHQEKAVNDLSNGKILWGPVGSGKSLVAAAYYMRKETPRDVYVITTAKKRDSLDWSREFGRFGVGQHRDDTVAGTLTVDSWNNLARYQKVFGAFFIFDEQRVVGSGSWVKGFLNVCRRNHWILLSATPGDTWLDYIPLFVANGYYKNRTEFKREHVVYNTFTKFPKVDRYIGVNRLVRLRNELLVEMPYLRSTVRKTFTIETEYDKAQFERVYKDRWNVFKDKPLRDVAELFLVMRKVVNSDPSRISAVRTLLEKHPRLIVFYNFDYELNLLRELFSTRKTNEKTELHITGESTTKANITNLTIQERNEQWQTHSPVCTELSDSESSESLRTTTSSLDSSTASAATSTLPDGQDSKDDFTNSTSITTSGSTFQLAEWNGHKHEAVPESDSWVYLVQYTAGAEGWNCIDTDSVVFYSLPYSYKIWEQAHGRIDRLDTPYSILNYYILRSDSIIDSAIFETLLKKMNFNERNYMIGGSLEGTNQDIGVTNRGKV